MATTTGTIDNITVNEKFCCVRVLLTGGSGGNAFIVLWSYFVQPDNATNRLTHGMYLNLIRDAWVGNRTVTFTHPSGSALVSQVQVD